MPPENKLELNKGGTSWVHLSVADIICHMVWYWADHIPTFLITKTIILSLISMDSICQ
jgi:hypothetical protein